MNTANFEIGDLVYLKSPRLRMIVSDVSVNGTIYAKYLDYDGNQRISAFNSNELLRNAKNFFLLQRTF